MPKRSKKKKIWYPDVLFKKLERINEQYSASDELTRTVIQFNKKHQKEFDPDDVIRAWKRWRKTSLIKGDKQ